MKTLICKITTLDLNGNCRLVVSVFRSRRLSPEPNFLVSFYENDMLHFLISSKIFFVIYGAFPRYEEAVPVGAELFL